AVVTDYRARHWNTSEASTFRQHDCRYSHCLAVQLLGCLLLEAQGQDLLKSHGLFPDDNFPKPSKHRAEKWLFCSPCQFLRAKRNSVVDKLKVGKQNENLYVFV
uniref:Uncharacterized protein n=1 Tax=Glossina palpalis gambiensis TaxID=67801 RepID=A0A1B0B8X0_9MUSC